jgi:hypothetical protein
VPCGIRQFGVTSIQRVTGAAPDMDAVMDAVVDAWHTEPWTRMDAGP